MVFLHRLPEIATRFNLDWHLDMFREHSIIAIAKCGAGAIAILFLPIILPLIAHAGVILASKLTQQKPKKFIETRLWLFTFSFSRKSGSLFNFRTQRRRSYFTRNSSDFWY